MPGRSKRKPKLVTGGLVYERYRLTIKLSSDARVWKRMDNVQLIFLEHPQTNDPMVRCPICLDKFLLSKLVDVRYNIFDGVRIGICPNCKQELKYE